MSKSKLAGSFLFSIGLIFFVLSFAYPAGDLENMGPGFFPRIISVILMVCALSSFFRK